MGVVCPHPFHLPTRAIQPFGECPWAPFLGRLGGGQFGANETIVGDLASDEATMEGMILGCGKVDTRRSMNSWIEWSFAIVSRDGHTTRDLAPPLGMMAVVLGVGVPPLGMMAVVVGGWR
jgi:hypothetical protein